MFKQSMICLALGFMAFAVPARAQNQDKQKADPQTQTPDTSAAIALSLIHI